MPPAVATSVVLLWIPLGAGASVPVVACNGRVYEALVARRERRPAQGLVHAALELRLHGTPYVVEMTPAWGASHRPQGAVATGPVGARVLGRSRFFRYEVHCWRDGVIPDRAHAIGVPTVVSVDGDVVERLLDAAPLVPTPVWGRDELGLGEMWNSNSVVAWLLAQSGADVGDLAPPAGRRAPGWSAGLAAAARG